MGLFRVFVQVSIPLAIISSLLVIFGLSKSSVAGSQKFLDFPYLGARIASDAPAASGAELCSRIRRAAASAAVDATPLAPFPASPLAHTGLLFRQIHPYFWAYLGVAFAIGFSVLGAAWCASHGTNPRPSKLQAERRLAPSQGHLHHRLESGGRGGQGAANHIKEPD